MRALPASRGSLIPLTPSFPHGASFATQLPTLVAVILLGGPIAGCNEEQPTTPIAFLGTLALSPDSATAWAGDAVTFVVTLGGPDANRALLESIRWSVSSDAVRALPVAVPGELRIVAQREGVATVVARLGEAADSAVVVAFAEGAVLATFPFPVEYMSAPAVAPDGSVYLFRVQDASPGLVALTPDLALRWTAPFGPTGATFLNPVVGPSGAVYFTQRGLTTAHSPDGTLLWASTFAGEEDAAPALDGAGNIYVHGFGADGIHRLARFSPSGDSTHLAEWGLPSRVAPTVVADSVVVWVSGAVVWATALDGTSLWTDTLPDQVRYFAPSVGHDGRTLYLPARSLVAVIDAFTGARGHDWLFEIAEIPLAPIVDRDGIVYVQTRERLLALNPDMSLRWTADSLGGGHTSNSGGGPALAAGGVLYVNCGTDLCAVRTLDGSVRWRRALPGPGSPGHIAIGPDSSIIFPMHIQVGDPSFVYKLRGRLPLADAPWPMDGRDPARTRRAPPLP